MKTFKDFLTDEKEPEVEQEINEHQLDESEVDFIELMKNNKHIHILVDEAAKVIMAKNGLTKQEVMDGLARQDKKLGAEFLKLISLGMKVTAGM